MLKGACLAQYRRRRTRTTTASSSRRWARRPMRWSGVLEGVHAGRPRRIRCRDRSGCAEIERSIGRSSTTRCSHGPDFRRGTARKTSPRRGSGSASPPRRSAVRADAESLVRHGSSAFGELLSTDHRLGIPRRDKARRTGGSTCAGLCRAPTAATARRPSTSTGRLELCAGPSKRAPETRAASDRDSSAATPAGRPTTLGREGSELPRPPWPADLLDAGSR